MTDNLTYDSRKSTDGTNNMNNSTVLYTSMYNIRVLEYAEIDVKNSALN